LQQPFPQQCVVMPVAFVHIKTQKMAFAHWYFLPVASVSLILYALPRSTARR